MKVIIPLNIDNQSNIFLIGNTLGLPENACKAD
ncbi:hypothetical protein FHS90_004629 [Rufibacter quisquiliarum]|uniref:Uncharacterized protein n=1 Tax=Rufibacter quisquiliarum TaxID=1549639 RepID=A0A839GZM2_9BACT|nr:hypothetical protein [Rufibacter quisquiliarum]